MIKRTKEWLRTKVIKKLNYDYKLDLDSQYISYDSYIKKHEIEYLDKLEKDFSLLPDDFEMIVEGDGIVDKETKLVMANAFRDKNIKLVYGDEDEYNNNETVRMNPLFRPEFSPNTLENYMYMGKIVGIRKDVLSDEGNLRDTVIQTCKKLSRENVAHVDYVLYHSHFNKEEVVYQKERKKYSEKVSIIIPSRDNPEILIRLLESLIKYTNNILYDIVIIDNGSCENNKNRIQLFIDDFFEKTNVGIKYIYSPQEFNFSKLCNEGAEHAAGSYFCFLNDDCEAADENWIGDMMYYATKPEVGAVGLKLYYPNSIKIQHCGVSNIRLGPVHKLQLYEDNRKFYGNMSRIDRDVIAVTGACLLISREKFFEGGKFNQELKVAFNDIALCFGLYKKGYYNVVVNSSFMYHHESLSRGNDDTFEKSNRLMQEKEILYKVFPELNGRDPFYPLHMTEDILDIGYSYSWIYEANRARLACTVKPGEFKGTLQDDWKQPCVKLAVEKWFEVDGRLTFAGFSYLQQIDNSCFRFFVMLYNDNKIYLYQCNKIYRPDMERNTDFYENCVNNGFYFYPDVSRVEKGRYGIGIMVKGLAYRMTFTGFSGRYVDIN